MQNTRLKKITVSVRLEKDDRPNALDLEIYVIKMLDREIGSITKHDDVYVASCDLLFPPNADRERKQCMTFQEAQQWIMNRLDECCRYFSVLL